MYVAAGMLAMSLGPQGVDESVSILRQARKDSRDVVSHVAALALALALDRAGQKAEATLVLSEVSHDNPPALLADPSAIESMGSTWDVEHAAMVALALDSVDPARAHREWTTYLEGPGGRGPWADHARQHTVVRRVPGVRGR